MVKSHVALLAGFGICSLLPGESMTGVASTTAPSPFNEFVGFKLGYREHRELNKAVKNITEIR
jgi:hypothetical protein